MNEAGTIIPNCTAKSIYLEALQLRQEIMVGSKSNSVNIYQSGGLFSYLFYAGLFMVFPLITSRLELSKQTSIASRWGLQYNRHYFQVENWCLYILWAKAGIGFLRGSYRPLWVIFNYEEGGESFVIAFSVLIYGMGMWTVVTPTGKPTILMCESACPLGLDWISVVSIPLIIWPIFNAEQFSLNLFQFSIYIQTYTTRWLHLSCACYM